MQSLRDFFLKSTAQLSKTSLIGLGFFLPLAASAQSHILDAGDTGSYIADNTDLGTAKPEAVGVALVNWFLGILTILAVIFILYGGITWMTSGGNEEKVGKAKKILIAAVIGLGIIMGAWGISRYVISKVLVSSYTDDEFIDYIIDTDVPPKPN